MRYLRHFLSLAVLLTVAALVFAAPRPGHARDDVREYPHDNARDYSRDRPHDRDRHRRDQVRRAVEAGEIKSLAEILKILQGKLPGDVAGVEIEHDDGHWLYELRVVDSKGRLYEVNVDARSGAIERIKEK